VEYGLFDKIIVTTQPTIWPGKRVLVTGGTGFIGFHLCHKLLSLGSEVWSVSLQANNQLPAPRLHVQEEDVSQPGAAQALLKEIKPEIIFHLASYVTGIRDSRAVIPTFEANVSSTVYLLAAAAEGQCERIVMVGSMEEPATDTPKTVPGSPYAVAKWTASAYGSLFFNLYSTPIINARLFMVYGPGQQDRTKIIPYTILSLLKQESPQFSSGRRLIDWVYVSDVVDGLIACAEAPGAVGQTVDIGTGVLLATKDVMEKISAVVDPTIPLGFGRLPDRPFEHERAADLTQTTARINWAPQVSLAEGLEKTIMWYRDHFS